MSDYIDTRPQATHGSAMSTAVVFDVQRDRANARREGKLKHGAFTVHKDGSGSITIYHGTGTGKVRQQAHLLISRSGWEKIREAITEALGS